MNTTRKPFVAIVTLVFGGLAVLFYGMYQREVEKDLMPAGTEIIGQIVRAELDVARRLNSRLLWSQLEDSSVLYKKDTIRTGPGSKVMVKLSNNSSIALGENTLVVLETENESLSLKLADGDVEFSGNVTVALGGNTKLRAVDGTLRLKRDSNSGRDKVAAVSGKAEVSSDGIVTLVEEGKVLVKGQEGAFKMSTESVQEAGLEDLGLKNMKAMEAQNAELRSKLNALEPKAKITKVSKVPVLRFSWRAPKEASKYSLKVGNKEFTAVASTFDINPVDLAPLVDEAITVQAIGSGQEGEPQVVKLDSAIRDAVVALGFVPVNKMPFDRARILMNKKKIKLQWSDFAAKNKDFSHYKVVIESKKGKLKEYRAKTASHDFEFPGSDAFTWSVQAVFDETGLGQKSVPTQFDVVGGAELAAPTITPASEEN